MRSPASAGTPLLSLVVPTYNEAANLEILIHRLERALSPVSYELIIVDDDSPDFTWQVGETLARRHASLRVIRRRNVRGLSSAVLRGFEESRGRILGAMDADLSHDEKILPQMIRVVQEGSDFAVASRRLPGGGATAWPWFRRLMSDAATTAARRLLRLPLTDPMSGFFLISREVYESCKNTLRPQGYKILLEIYCKSRHRRVTEIPYIFTDRRQGYSKLTGRVAYQYLKMLLELFRWQG